MTLLYIKTHNVTGLKYFGKTTQEDCFKYKGKGLHWSRHIKKHGYDVSTIVYAKFDEDDFIERILLQGCALLFSEENNIVESEEWANIIPENGLDGAPKGTKLSDDHKLKISNSLKGIKQDPEIVKKRNQSVKGYKKTKEQIEKTRQAHIGSKRSLETCINISNGLKGHKTSDETKAKMILSHKKREKIECKHCEKKFDEGNFKRWHGVNCKLS